MAWHVTRQNFIGREVVIALGVLAVLTSLVWISAVPLLALPGYLIVVVYNYVQNIWFPSIKLLPFYLTFALYLYGGAVVIANLYLGFRQATRHGK